MRTLTFGVLVRQDNGQRFRIRDEVIVIGRNYDIGRAELVFKT